MEPVARLEAYRDYLRLVARIQLPIDVQRKLDDSDLVEETLLRARERFAQFAGRTEGDLTAWLRSILSHQLLEVLRRIDSDKPIADVETSMEKAREDSASRLEYLLAAEGGSSQHAVLEKDLVKLAAALAQLPAEQRQAVEWRHLLGASVAEIARNMERSKVAVGGLLRGGTKRLRELLMN
jgi:RNA polymerase sigma-70 factor, ECF subfamily